MRISVVVPVYKTEKYIKKCVDSILRQTFTDFEILLVDDGSPDRSGEICDGLSLVNTRIRTIHQENGGVTSARAKGVTHACGEWICFVDSDDTLPSDVLERLSEGIHPKTDIVIGFWDERKIVKQQWMDIEEYRKACITGKKIYPGPCARLFRRSIFNKNTFDIPRVIVKGEDMLMNIRLSFTTVKDVRIVPYKVYNYLAHPESCVHNFIPTCDYEYLFYQERLRAIPTGLQNHYKCDCIKNSLKALYRIIKHSKSVNGIADSQFVAQLKKDIAQVHYSQSLKDRFLMMLKMKYLLKVHRRFF